MMKKHILLISALTAAFSLSAQTLTIDRKDGIYDSAKDKEIVLKVQSDKWMEFKVLDRTVILPPTTAELKFPVAELKTNWVLAEAWQLDENQKRTGTVKRVGALVDPYKIKAGAPEPEDFDAFWQQEIEAMRAVPMNPVLEEVKEENPNIRTWKFKLDCGKKNFAYGFISMPANAKAKSLPAVAQFHGASTMGLPKNYPTYAEYAIQVTMSPHQSECGRDWEYYKQIAKSVYGYSRRGVEKRETYYLKGMILRVLRTLEFIKSRPEWDGKNLLTRGESQGGFQALVGAALDQDVSFCLAMVPAMSDHLGFKQGNPNGWPQVIHVREGRPANGIKFAQTVEGVLPYYDNTNFAKRIKCPIHLSTGLLDITCPPSGILAVYNNLPAETEKHLYIAPRAGHEAGYPGSGKLISGILKQAQEKQ